MKKSRVFLAAVFCSALLLPAGRTFAQDNDKPFSGELKTYTDTYNGFQIGIPVELEQRAKTAGGDWTSPAGATGILKHMSIFVNVADFHGHAAMSTVYQINVKSNKENRDHKNTVAWKPYKWGKDTIYSFRTDEADHKAGQADAKDPDEIHRVYLFVYGQGRQYEIMAAGQFEDFKNPNVRETVDKVFKSFKPVAVK